MTPKVKNALLAGLVLAAMGPGAAYAHETRRDNDSSCFSYRSGSGYVKLCSGTPEVKREVYYKPVAYRNEPTKVIYVYAPPGQSKAKWKHNKHNKHYTYRYYDDHDHDRHDHRKYDWRD
ncbi:MAG: hypothetical protein H6869_09095 [Rhodospirillales bacterium]|nr:hypothetical protein [Rhodospirillales bacterium]